VRRTLKTRLTRLESQSVAPKLEVLWVDVDQGETREGALKKRYGDQVPPDVEVVLVSWKPQE
jgi:hypothetical protein